MTLPENLDQDKLAEAALAILSLSAWDEEHGACAWKGMDWDVLDILYRKGWIGDPMGKKKSVHITEHGAALAVTYLEKHFGK